jgi:hypothetical protein
VSRIGVLTFSGYFASAGRNAPSFSPASVGANWNGNVYCLTKNLPANGHLMKEMVLPAFLAGSFGRDSVFWKKYFDKDGPMYAPISYHMVR